MSDEPTVRPFADWLREQGQGDAHADLSQGLHDLIAAVRETGKKGTLTFRVEVAPMKQDVDVLLVTDDLKLGLPKPDKRPSLFYPDSDGNLTRTDPNQLSFESLRDVSEPTPTTEKDLKDAR